MAFMAALPEVLGAVGATGAAEGGAAAAGAAEGGGGLAQAAKGIPGGGISMPGGGPSKPKQPTALDRISGVHHALSSILQAGQFGA